MTLLLGPPGSGKTSLLLALAGKLDNDLKVSISKCALVVPSYITFAVLWYGVAYQMPQNLTMVQLKRCGD